MAKQTNVKTERRKNVAVALDELAAIHNQLLDTTQSGEDIVRVGGCIMTLRGLMSSAPRIDDIPEEKAESSDDNTPQAEEDEEEVPEATEEPEEVSKDE